MSRRHHQHHRRKFHGSDLLQDSSNAQAQAEQQDIKRQVATLVSIVYKTAIPTFDGPVGGYTTIIPSIQAPTIQTTPTPIQASQAVTSATQQQSSLAASTTVLSTVPAASSASNIAASVSSALIGSSVNSIQTSSSIQATVVAPSSSSLLISIKASSPSLTNASPTFSILSTSAPAAVSSASQASSSDSATVSKHESKGLTDGAKAGIAIGVILGLVAIVGLIAFCCLRRKKQQQKAHDRPEDEKNPFGDNAATPAPPRTSLPPQIGLRPLMESRPEMVTQANDNNPLSLIGGSAAISRQDVEKGPIDRPNPFEEQVEASRSTPADDHSMLSKQEIPAPLRIRTPTPEAVAQTGILAGASATIAQRHNTPKPLDIKRAISPIPAAPSPAGTEFSMMSTSQGSMANNLPSNNVHRIQLDFKPSMEDELELCAGQLVRLLHEYDDGWVRACLANMELSLISFLGFMYPLGSISAGCRSSLLSIHSTCQASC